MVCAIADIFLQTPSFPGCLLSDVAQALGTRVEVSVIMNNISYNNYSPKLSRSLFLSCSPKDGAPHVSFLMDVTLVECEENYVPLAETTVQVCFYSECRHTRVRIGSL